MFWLLMVALGVVIFVVLVFRHSRRGLSLTRSHALNFGLGSAIPVVMIIVMILLVAPGIATKHQLKWEDPKLSLVSLQDPSSAHEAKIFLFITEESDKITYYTYWYKDGKGFRQGQLSDADNVIVYEDSSDTPRLVQVNFQREYCGDWDWADFIPVQCSQQNADTARWEFHVPPGTVIRMISIN